MPRLAKAPSRPDARLLAMQAEQTQRYYDLLYSRYMANRSVATVAAPPRYAQQRQSDGNTIWQTLVHHAQRHRTSTQALLAAMFSTWDGREPPRPHHAMGASLLASLPEFNAAAIDAAQIQLATDRQNYEKQQLLARSFEVSQPEPRSTMQLAREVLANDASQLSALFRYSVARHLKMQDIAQIVREQADAQFLSFPPAYLKTAWRHLLAKRHSVVMASHYGSEGDTHG